MRRRFFTLDVFTTRRFAGNPLAVLLESGGLDDALMQAIAREFNLPETVFVFPAGEPGHKARLRIFTPARELPFAGHPTVGTAVLLTHLDGGTQERGIVLGETIGPVACTVMPGAGGGSASFVIPRLPEKLGALDDKGALAAALSLATADIGFGGFELEAWTSGNAFAFVPVSGLEALGRAQPNMAHWDKALGVGGPPGIFLFSAGDGNLFRARMFAPAMGVVEDPATGSAAAAFAGVLAASGSYGDGEHRVAIGQGFEMGRPSTIRLGMTMRGGVLATATVGGEAVIVSEGTIEA